MSVTKQNNTNTNIPERKKTKSEKKEEKEEEYHEKDERGGQMIVEVYDE